MIKLTMCRINILYEGHAKLSLRGKSSEEKKTVSVMIFPLKSASDLVKSFLALRKARVSFITFVLIVEEKGFTQKRRQRSSLLLGGQH